MIRNGILTFTTLASTIFFPWPLTALLAFVASFFEPLVPLAAGVFADTLYYSPAEGGFPIFSLYGLALTAGAVFVRSRMRTGTITQ